MRAVDLSADAFPLIRCGFCDKGGRPNWEDRGYTAKHIVTLAETENTDIAMNEFLLQEIDEANGPQVKIKVLRSSNKDTLCVIINHMLVDAAGFRDYLYLLGEIYTALEKNSAYCPDSAMGKRNLLQIIKTFSFFDLVKIFVRENDVIRPKTGADKFDFEGDLDNPFIEMREISRERFLAIKSYAKKHSATVNDVLLTAYIRTLYQFLGSVADVPCAVDLRKYLPDRKAGSMCNLISNLPCSIGDDLGNSFSDTLEKVKAEMNRQKADISCMKSVSLMEFVYRVMPYGIAKGLIEKAYSNAPIAISNLGVLNKEKLNFGKNEMTGAFMTGSIKYNPFFHISVSGFDNTLALSINLYGTKKDRKKISGFLDYMVSELFEAIKD
jgi:Uncharacterized protein containing a NRPS condensation (elongation) domain